MDTSAIIGQLPQLPRDDLKKINAAIGHLLKGEARNNHTDGTVALFSALTTTLGTNLPYASFTATSSHVHWAKSAPDVVQFIDTTFPTATRIEKRAIMMFLIEALIDDLKTRKVPISIGSVVTNIGFLPQIFDSAFPEYRKNGLALLVLKAMVKGK